MNDCLFCKIISGEIPSYKIYEDENFYAFLDIRPLNPGHTLVIPKKHFRWVWDIENIGEYYKVIQNIAKSLKKTMETEYIISLVFGEEVPHAHVWLIPRLKNDGHGEAINLNNIKTISSEEMEKIAKSIKNNL
ncbi:HIT domain-containing protein [Patescibacteria group bacterium]|nr:HIT domain-containing protein [Patescibacteria group bacterium]